MIHLFPFLFRFGVSFNYSIPKEIILSLKDFFEKKYKIEIGFKFDEDSFDCIAIKDDEAKDFSPIAAHKFLERLDEYKIKDYENSILFIDIKEAYSDKFVDHIIPELVKIKSENITESLSFPKFILYLDDLAKGSLTYDKIFLSQSNHKVLDYSFVFDKSQNVIDTNLNISKDSTLHKLINDISTSSLEKFQFKLVRKINHFIRADETNPHIACQQFFYEGRNCQVEAYQLVKDELTHLRLNKNVNPHYIVYDCFSSEWLATAIVTVANYLSSESQSESFSNLIKKEQSKPDNFFNLNDKDDSRNKNEWKDENELEIIFITDLIHTGNTFKDKIKKLKNKFPQGKIHCLSALITDVAFDEFKSTRVRKIKIGDYEIKYFKKVEQIYKPKLTNRTDCNICKHKLLPSVPTNAEITKNLSSFEMWLMCEESGYKLEDYRPRKNREDENRVMPDSLKLFKRNGTLLAIKFEQHLKINNILPHDEIVIIFPDETKNDHEGGELPESIEKTPSGYFAKCLNFYNESYSYLGIPRKMIRLLEEGNVDLNEVKKLFPKTFQRIEDIDKPIIIMDEVNFTGKTFKTITDILHIKGKSPVCYFPVFNFDAEATNNKYYDNQYESVKFLSLYELNYSCQ